MTDVSTSIGLFLCLNLSRKHNTLKNTNATLSHVIVITASALSKLFVWKYLNLHDDQISP